MKKSTAFCLTVICTSLSLSASAMSLNPVDSYLEKKTDKGFNEIIDDAYSSDKGRQNFYKSIQNYISSHPDRTSVANANELAINVTSMLFPQFAGYWDNVATWNEIPVYQNHDLFDMDRYSLPKKIDMGKSSLSNDGTKFVNGAKNSISTTPYARTEILMSQGHPGVGPDGESIRLCRLYNSAFAPYVEIANYDAKSLFPLIGSGTVASLCMPESLTRDYWTGRKADFFNNFGDSIQPEKTLQSY